MYIEYRQRYEFDCMIRNVFLDCYFFFDDTATTEIYTLSLHDALPISSGSRPVGASGCRFQRTSPSACMRQASGPATSPRSSPTRCRNGSMPTWASCAPAVSLRSEEHTSELQSRLHLVCRLLLEKKNRN